MQIEFLHTAPTDLAKSRIDAARSGIEQAKGQENAKVRKAAEEFEAIFISQMITPMFETVETDGLMGGGHAEGIYRSMMVDAFGREMAAKGGIGIADSVYRELIKLQEQ